MSINIAEVNWKNDGITRRYITERYELLMHPGAMTARELADAHTYCVEIENPYAEEMCRRAGLLEGFEKQEPFAGYRGLTIRAAAERLGIKLC